MTSEHGRWILGGGLASGKSHVRRLLTEAGISTIDSDSLGHSVLEPGGQAFGAVAETWPRVVVDGRIDRSALAAVVFNDPTQLRLLEMLTHPHITAEIVSQTARLALPVVVEVPVLKMPFSEEWRRLVVDSSDEMKLARAIERGMSQTDAASRLGSQPSRAEWLAAADLVIPNHGSLADLEDAVDQVIPHL